MMITSTPAAYQMVGDWHEGHGWPRIPTDLLPPLCALGFIDDRAVCAVWAYDCTPGIAWMDYMVTNPDSGMKGAIALKELCGQYSDMLTEQGVKYIHSCCRQGSLGKLLEKIGFQKTDKNVTHFIKINADR